MQLTQPDETNRAADAPMTVSHAWRRDRGGLCCRFLGALLQTSIRHGERVARLWVMKVRSMIPWQLI